MSSNMQNMAKNPFIYAHLCMGYQNEWKRMDKVQLRADNRMPAGSDHQFRRATVCGFAHPDG